MSAITSIEMNTLAHASQQATPARGADEAREFLGFRIGDEEYGIDILQVQEIRSYETPLRLAGAPTAVKGVLHLRGTIVPVVDLRLHWGAAEAGHDAATVTIVLNLRGRVVGMVVDAVSDVIAPGANQIKPPPQFNHPLNADHLCGIATLPGAEGDRLLILIDIEALLSDPRLGLIAST